MGGSFGGMMLRHANRLSCVSSDSDCIGTAVKNPLHKLDKAARQELGRIRHEYSEAKLTAAKQFMQNFSAHKSKLISSGVITGNETIRELLVAAQQNKLGFTED